MMGGHEPGPLEVGIFARTFPRDSLDQTLQVAADHGFRLLHFNFACAGLPSLPDALEPAVCQNVREAFTARGLLMLGVSATYNTIHPDPVRRAADTARAIRLIELSPLLGTRFVSLSTGTRDPENMWQHHRSNEDPAAWTDLLATLDQLVQVAEHSGVVLGIEPERNNVVSSAGRAVRLLDEMRSASLGIILDPANLVDPSKPDAQRATLSEAMDLLAPRTVMLHAKDVTAADHVAAGLGMLDYEYLFDLVDRHRVSCPIVIHDVEEFDVDRARNFVEALAARRRERLVSDG